MLIFADETYALKTMKQTIRLLFLTVLLLTGIQVPIVATTANPTIDSLYTSTTSTWLSISIPPCTISVRT